MGCRAARIAAGGGGGGGVGADTHTQWGHPQYETRPGWGGGGGAESYLKLERLGILRSYYICFVFISPERLIAIITNHVQQNMYYLIGKNLHTPVQIS